MSLLGYRLDFLASGRVKVTSIYSPTKDLNLLFTSSVGDVGTMALLGEGENSELGEEIKRQSGFWVQERGSIPAFLASLQLTLFDQTSGGASAGRVVG